MSTRILAVTILAALLAVLTVASVARAECAWVLWKFFPGEGRFADTWGTPEAFTSAQECARGLAEAHNVHKSLHKDAEGRRVKETMFSPYRGLVVVLFETGKMFQMETYCLPSTTDPRGPKTK